MLEHSSSSTALENVFEKLPIVDDSRLYTRELIVKYHRASVVEYPKALSP